jgi:hypothetical protein
LQSKAAQSKADSTPLPRRRFFPALVWLVALLSGCATPYPMQTALCASPSGTPMTVFELFFGRSVRGDGEVSDQAWNDFLEQVVTPNLPNGYTVFDAVGAWRNPATGHTVHERTKVLLVALPVDAASAAAVARIRSAYQVQFHQMLVGMTVAPACGSF